MEDKREIFLNHIEELFPNSKKIYQKHIEECDGEDILWIILFDEIGRNISEKFKEIAESDKIEIFESIEIQLSDDNLDLSTALYTGLIEGLVDESMRIENQWAELQKFMGEKSLEHAHAMNKFYGIE